MKVSFSIFLGFKLRGDALRYKKSLKPTIKKFKHFIKRAWYHGKDHDVGLFIVEVECIDKEFYIKLRESLIKKIGNKAVVVDLTILESDSEEFIKNLNLKIWEGKE